MNLTQTVAIVSVGVLLTTAAIVWRWWKPRPHKNLRCPQRFRSVGDTFAKAAGKSLPVEEFDDWKAHYFRILVAARRPARWAARMRADKA